MKINMEIMQLRDPKIFPDNVVLENALAESYLVYTEMIETITGNNYGLAAQWNYYKDGKAWLCKMCYKNKTIFWLSVWDKFFKTSFYFTEKNGAGIADIDIDEGLKKSFYNKKPVGKLIPLTINISTKIQLKDLLKLIEYKKNLK
jgi:hypothetical protein